MTAGAARFDNRRNLIVQALSTAKRPLTRFIWPIPRAIASLMTVKPNFPTHYKAQGSATLQVFSYDAADVNLLQLAGHNWNRK